MQLLDSNTTWFEVELRLSDHAYCRVEVLFLVTPCLQIKFKLAHFNPSQLLVQT